MPLVLRFNQYTKSSQTMKYLPLRPPPVKIMSTFKKIVPVKPSLDSIEDISSLNIWKKFKVIVF